MVKVNGHLFAENKKEITDSLFHKGGTSSGYIKRYKRKIIFYDLQDNPIAYVNCYGSIGIARNLSKNELSLMTTNKGSKIWFSYGTPYFCKNVMVKDLWEIPKDLSIGEDSKGLYFK